MADERNAVRRFFEEYNRTTARHYAVRFEVIDWENYSSAGVGRPQELITEATLERYRSSLALVVGLMGQRFGEATGVADSGTEEEFNWALDSFQKTGFPEIKWFFRRVDQFKAPSDPTQIQKALLQWQKVIAFRERLKTGANGQPVFFKEFSSAPEFPDILRHDLTLWLNDPARPWTQRKTDLPLEPEIGFTAIPGYYESVVEDFRRLDIAGIDNDRAFEIPLSDVYLRLRVMFDDDSRPADVEKLSDTGPIDIHAALQRYQQLVIVGDPGSGKSTFLKYIALMLARAVHENAPKLALETLGVGEPLPIPLFVSCWDLSDFLKGKEEAKLDMLLDFFVSRLAAHSWSIDSAQLEQLLAKGACCLLFDGLDEVPTEAGRSIVSRLLEQCVSKFSKNRYVVTSRVRAYTGDTILKGKFVRADVQQLTAEDRRQFLQNWFALLLRVRLEEVLVEGSEGRRHLDTLSNAIEGNPRLRSLAVNPLLLTVISIVHWNRKRLPEQRTDLYDECVDVLLGQRKEAEKALRAKKTTTLEEKHEDDIHEDRAWTRKRFAEIALQILCGEGEEVTKDDVIQLLVPRFRMRSATTEEKAVVQAELFLERQELKSGLLVSRRSHSYRFVHLTFQEYLAAWNLANQNFDQVIPIVSKRLRSARWFETLQLLGGEWAKSSDEKLDAYVKWLLEQRGGSVGEQAPVVALCANIVRDTSGTAELQEETRRTFEQAVRATLAAFRDSSGVYETTQLEILEALGRLGAAVKDHLIEATKCSRYAVRRRAIEMLVPHLPDNDLFGMQHVLEDRSQEPITTYLQALFERDLVRAARLLKSLQAIQPKAAAAILRFTSFLARMDKGLSSVVAMAFRARALWDWRGLRSGQLSRIAHGFNDPVTWALVQETFEKDPDPGVRADAFQLHVERLRTTEEIWRLVKDRIANDEAITVRAQGIALLAKWRTSEPETWAIVRDNCGQSQPIDLRQTAMSVIVQHRASDAALMGVVVQIATNDESSDARARAVRVLTHALAKVPQYREVVERAGLNDPSADVRLAALQTYSDSNFDQNAVYHFSLKIAQKDGDPRVRRLALQLAAARINVNHFARQLLVERYANYFTQNFIDPAEPITRKEVARFAKSAGRSAEEIESMYEDLSARLPGVLKLAWKEQSLPPPPSPPDSP